MERILIDQRADWERKIQEIGFVYYKNYYLETAAYTFKMDEILEIEKATTEIFDLCCRGMEHVLANPDVLAKFAIPKQFHPCLAESWRQDHCSFYGRFDLAYKNGQVKLLEFNADTPTSLLEASVVQWYWLKDYEKSHGKTYDQFNSIHEKLMEHMKVCKPYIPGKVHFASTAGSTEDYVTVKYLESCAHEAGIQTSGLSIQNIAVNPEGQFCAGENGEVIQNIFKLYPYEWMFREAFADDLRNSFFSGVNWIEPFYKAIWSNKQFLVVLAELFPDSPYILKCQNEPLTIDYVRKPMLSREGQNVQIVKGGEIIAQTPGIYGEEGYVFQEYCEIPLFNGKAPVIGSWLIGGVPAGIGIRESDKYITDNMANFVSHFIKE